MAGPIATPAFVAAESQPSAFERSSGFVAALELNPQKARVLLQQALTRTKDVAAVQKYFEEY